MLRLVLLLTLLAAPVHAQTGGAPTAAECVAGPISFVLLDNNSIFDTSDPDLDERFLWAYRTANALHIRTRRWVIRRELLFQPGDCYDPFLLAESERLLRAYPFLARVDIHGVPQPDGSHHVIVDTHDDWSTRVDIRFRVDRDVRLEGVRLSELNFLGMGQALGVFWFERDVTRDYGLSYWTPQIGRTRWDLAASVGRTRAGSFFREQISYPFVGEVGHWAGRHAFSRDEQFFDYVVTDDPAGRSSHVLVPLQEKSLEASLLRRFGDRGDAHLAGLGLSWAELRRQGPVEIAPQGDFDDRVPADSAAIDPIRRHFAERDAVRVHVLLGSRDVRWIKRRGLDSMRGDEDVRLGWEAGAAFGRTLPGSRDRDVTLAALLYGGLERDGLLFVTRARADALRADRPRLDDPTWQDVRAEGELFAYLRSTALERHTFLVRATAAAAWNTVTPFQLTLGGERGVRGYDLERYPGGRRVVLTAEDRIYLGWPLRDVFDSGFTVFADAGRIWPGDAPFGMDSGWRASAGAGLRFSFPAESRTTYRVDFAWPIERATRLGDFQIRVSIGELIGVGGANTDLQFRRSRRDGIAADLFRFAGAQGS